MLLKHIESQSSSSTVSHIHTLSSIASSLPVPLSPIDLSLLLTYLTRDKPSLTTKVLTNGTILVKQGTAPITDTDITIATLKQLHSHLSSQIPLLESSIAQYTNTAREAISSKNTSAARAALRRKKLVSDAMEKRHDQAFSVQQTLDKIDQAADNVAMVHAMEASAGVLQKLIAEVGGAEGAEKVTDRLAEEMSTVDEISAVINEPGVGQVVDEGEVDEEFEALVHEDAERVRKENILMEEKKRAEKAREQEEQQKREAAETRKKIHDLDHYEQQKKENIAATQQGKEDSEVAKAADKIAEMSL